VTAGDDQPAGAPAATPAPAPAPARVGAPAPADGAPDSARGYIAATLARWREFLTAAGAIGAALVGYTLAKELGEGDPRRHDQLVAIVSIGAFGLGAALLLAVPLVLTGHSRATLSAAVAMERRNRRWYRPWAHDRVVVAPEVLYGHPTVEAFQDALVAALDESRTTYWDNDSGFVVPAALERRITTYVAQREEAQLHVAANQVRASSTRAVWLATIGLLLVVAGYGNATFVTNQAKRRATVHDAERVAQVARDDKILTAALAPPPAGQVVPAVPTDVVVAFPDAAAAASALGVPTGELDASCWSAGRAGRAYDLVDPTPGADPRGIVLVLLQATSTTCPTQVVRVDPSWLHPPGTAVAAPATTAPPPATTAVPATAPATTAVPATAPATAAPGGP
jgi:hypothetical protein